MTDSALYFTLALELAAKSKWTCKPNPAVGAVIVKQGKVLSLGYTQSVGNNHAEIEALKVLKNDKSALKNSTLYVSLMPCSFTGKTPPCTDAIIKSGIREVHIALLDNDPRIKNTRGKDISEARLRAHNIKVIYDCPIEIAQKLFYLNWDYYKKNATGLPSFTLKYAMSGDGKIAPPPPVGRAGRANKKRLLLSNPASILQVHEERAQHEAILVGGRTLIADNPQLNVRIPKTIQASFSQPVRKFAWETPAYLFGNKISTAVPFKNLLPKLLQPTPLVLSRSDITKHLSTTAPIAMLSKNRSPAPLFIVPGKHKAIYQKLSNFPEKFFWSSKSKIEMSSGYAPSQTEFWKDFSRQTSIYSVYVEGGAALQHLLLPTGLYDRVSIYLSSRFLFDSSALSPFTGSKNKHKSTTDITSLWHTHFITLGDNVCMRGFLNQVLAKKIWRGIYPVAK